MAEYIKSKFIDILEEESKVETREYCLWNQHGRHKQ